MANENTDGHSESINNGIDSELITATLFPDHERLSFTPQLFGPSLMMQGESLVFRVHNHMTGRSHNGYWNFYKLSNGAFYMAPEKDELLHITWPSNGFDDVLTSDASGVVATMFALNYLLHEFGNKHLETMFWKLEDFARSHSERQKIFRAID